MASLRRFTALLPLYVAAGCAAHDGSATIPDDGAGPTISGGANGEGSPPDSAAFAAALFPKHETTESKQDAVIAPAAPPEEAPAAYFVDDGLPSREDAFPADLVDVDDFCRRFIVRVTAESVTREGGHGGTPTCREITLPVAFKGDATYRHVRAMRLFDGISTWSTLLLDTQGGVAALPVSWDVEDPTDPGCPGIVRTIALDELRLQSGYLVVVSLGEDMTWVEVPETSVDDDGARRRLIRDVLVVRTDGSDLHTRSFETHYDSTLREKLGEKVQPSMRGVPWANVKWRGQHAFRIEAGGALRVL